MRIIEFRGFGSAILPSSKNIVNRGSIYLCIFEIKIAGRGSMFCKYCRKKIDDDSVFCSSCGKDVSSKEKKETSPSIKSSPPVINIEKVSSQKSSIEINLDTKTPPRPKKVKTEKKKPPFKLDPKLLSIFQGAKVHIFKNGKFFQLESGSINIEGSSLSLKSMMMNKYILDLSEVETIEHKKDYLILRTPHNFYKMQFLKVDGKTVPTNKSLIFREKFAEMLGLIISEGKDISKRKKTKDPAPTKPTWHIRDDDEELRLNPLLVSVFQGMKVSTWEKSGGSKIRKGSIDIDDSSLFIKSILKHEYVLNLSKVKSLEHQGLNLLLRTPKKIHAINFNKKGNELIALKEQFAEMLGLDLKILPKEELPAGCVVAVIVFLVVMAIIGSFLPEREKSSVNQTPDRKEVSENNIVKSFQSKLYDKEDGLIVVAISEEAWEEFMAFVIAGDRNHSARMRRAGRLFYVTSGTRIHIDDGGFFSSKIRVLEGPHLGKMGWVPNEMIQTEYR